MDLLTVGGATCSVTASALESRLVPPGNRRQHRDIRRRHVTASVLSQNSGKTCHRKPETANKFFVVRNVRGHVDSLLAECISTSILAPNDTEERCQRRGVHDDLLLVLERLRASL